jgi:hypothetical protein
MAGSIPYLVPTQKIPGIYFSLHNPSKSIGSAVLAGTMVTRKDVIFYSIQLYRAEEIYRKDQMKKQETYEDK